jgi:hypothetical protein
MDIYGQYFGKPVDEVSDSELLEAIWSLEGQWMARPMDEEEYAEWWSAAWTLNKEAVWRGLGCHFEIFQD